MPHLTAKIFDSTLSTLIVHLDVELPEISAPFPAPSGPSLSSNATAQPQSHRVIRTAWILTGQTGHLVVTLICSFSDCDTFQADMPPIYIGIGQMGMHRLAVMVERSRTSKIAVPVHTLHAITVYEAIKSLILEYELEEEGRLVTVSVTKATQCRGRRTLLCAS